MKALAIEQKAMINWVTFQDEVGDWLTNSSPDNWRAVFRPLIRGLVTDQVNRWSAHLGLKWNVQNLFARDWYRNYLRNFPISIIQTTADAVAKLIDQALREGWSVPNMQSAITDTFGIMEPYRTERIARTEIIRASNGGTHEQFSEWGVQRQEWLSTHDDRVRTYDNTDGEYDHLEADGQVVGINEPFMVSGEALAYPGDPNGSAGNTINCRCAILPVLEGME